MNKLTILLLASILFIGCASIRPFTKEEEKRFDKEYQREQEQERINPDIK